MYYLQFTYMLRINVFGKYFYQFPTWLEWPWQVISLKNHFHFKQECKIPLNKFGGDWVYNLDEVQY